MADNVYITSNDGISAAGGLSAGKTSYFADKVGIGIDIPSAPLHVACLNGISTLVIHRDGNDPTTNTALNRISFKTDFSSVESDVGQIDVCTNCSTYRTDMGFSVKSTGGNICRGLTIHGTTNDGPRIGIGTATPDKTLVVRGTDAEVVIDDIDSTDTPRLRFRESGNTSGQISTDNCDLRLFTQSSERMRLVNSTGNIGIGTTTPNERLTVKGAISGDSCIMLCNGLCIQAPCTTSILRAQNSNGYIEMGPVNTGFAHIQTDRNRFYFNKCIVLWIIYSCTIFTNTSTKN